MLPDAKKFDGVAIAKPIGDKVVRSFGVFVAGDVRDADEILLVPQKNGDGFRIAQEQMSIVAKAD